MRGPHRIRRRRRQYTKNIEFRARGSPLTSCVRLPAPVYRWRGRRLLMGGLGYGHKVTYGARAQQPALRCSGGVPGGEGLSSLRCGVPGVWQVPVSGQGGVRAQGAVCCGGRGGACLSVGAVAGAHFDGGAAVEGPGADVERVQERHWGREPPVQLLLCKASPHTHALNLTPNRAQGSAFCVGCPGTLQGQRGAGSTPPL